MGPSDADDYAQPRVGLQAAVEHFNYVVLYCMSIHMTHDPPQVLDALLPLLDGDDAAWLQQHTLPFKRFQQKAKT
jgi:hypothetical protein